ncbi:NfeD family protein [Parabacteroides pacaensis]|uniref:NfeD family protein n=1 Tax=Parabacteroides pacaensis TaxID=2086575 RepID=UPI000D0FCB6C|nr:NfeD family protein [Parabacteroides pacaensis]
MILDIAIIAFLLGLAIGLLLMEIFLLPGITVAGIGGVFFAVGGVAYAYLHVSVLAGNISLAASLLMFGILFVWLVRSKALDRIALKKDIEGKLITPSEQGIKAGDAGITLSRLNPMGKIKVNGITAEGKSLGEFIPEETPVVVFRVEMNTIIVKPKELN